MLARRPLTILLLVAMLSLNALAWGLFRESGTLTGNVILSALYFGQFAPLSLWFGIARSHWWTRSAVWLAAALSSLLLGDDTMERTTSFVLAVAYGVCVALAARWLRNYLPDASASADDASGKSPWQFSLLHLLVWMTLVAVVSTVARYSDLEVILSALVAAQLASMVLVPLICLLLLYGRERVLGRFALLLGVCGLLGMCFAFAYPDPMEHTLLLGVIAFYLIMGAVTGIWVIVVSKETFPAPDRKNS